MNNESNESLEGAITIENEDHILYPGEKKQFIKIEFLEPDVRKEHYPEGMFMEKEKAIDLIKKGLAKLKIIPKERRQKEFVRCKILHRGLRNSYENGIAHFEKEKALRLQAEGHLKIVEGLPH